MNFFEDKRTQILANGQATPEAQVKYLNVCLKVARDKASTVEKELEALRLEKELELNTIKREMAHLFKLQERFMIESAKVSKLKRSWKFWTKK